jgi:hypothetical protein
MERRCAMYPQTKVTNDVVIELNPGQSAEIPGHSNATVENVSNEAGALHFRLNPPPVTEGTIPVPAHDSRPLELGSTGGTVKNVGEVQLTIVYFIG